MDQKVLRNIISISNNGSWEPKMNPNMFKEELDGGLGCDALA
jgi:hypothetical protein